MSTEISNIRNQNEYYKLFSGSITSHRFGSMFGPTGVMPYAYLERIYLNNPEVVEFLQNLVGFYTQKPTKIELARLFLEEKIEKKLCRIPVDRRANTLGSSRLKSFLLGSYGYGEVMR
jgi:hypothetical protein